DQGVIDLRSEEMIEHIHGGGEQHALIRLTSAACEDLGEECFSDARVADDNDAGAIADELQIQKAKKAVLHLQTALVMIELEAVDRVTNSKMGQSEAPLNASCIPGFQFTIDERFQGGG